jgi:mono/diheme cytochrome c family protein
MRKLLASIGLGVLLFTAVAGAAEPDAKSVRLFKTKCASCHGEDGTGATAKGKELGVKSMAAADWQKKLTDAKIKEAISTETAVKAPDGKETKVHGYGASLKPEQIDVLVTVVRSFGPK